MANVPGVPPNSNFPELSTLCAGFPFTFAPLDTDRDAFLGKAGLFSTALPFTNSASPSLLTIISSPMTFGTIDFRRGAFFVGDPVAVTVDTERDLVGDAVDAALFFGEVGVGVIFANSA